ncbi:MAG: RdgB/HAM1 family non-canonical purine NTP pyrophosphatase [Thiotrichales bacterium]|nr:RdgB/HAM1 family non-canonical purine NTP pyrophosphatase [Thiotrichales bacterium]
MNQMMVLATNNPHKVAEISPMIFSEGFDCRPQQSFFHGSVEEDGMSFMENALKKARYASAQTGLPAIADDSGLEVEALRGQPGIFSARYAAGTAGEASDEENVEKLLQQMAGLPYAQRKARYSCAVVYVEHAEDAMPLVGIGHWYGEILMQRRSGQGIGYDDVMWIPNLVKAVSEVPLEIKNRISHRAQAVQSVLNQLKQKGQPA